MVGCVVSNDATGFDASQGPYQGGHGESNCHRPGLRQKNRPGCRRLLFGSGRQVGKLKPRQACKRPGESAGKLVPESSGKPAKLGTDPDSQRVRDRSPPAELMTFASQSFLPRGVIGNTTDFGSVILGSSPSGVAGECLVAGIGGDGADFAWRPLVATARHVGLVGSGFAGGRHDPQWIYSEVR